jgi:hypothetical protein
MSPVQEQIIRLAAIEKQTRDTANILATLERIEAKLDALSSAQASKPSSKKDG